MIDTPQIAQFPGQRVALIHLTIPRDEIGQVMGPGVNEVYAAVRDQRLPQAGRWLNHHLRIDPDVFDFEICVPVRAEVQAVGRVVPGMLAPATVARTEYHGRYEDLAEAWAEFRAWVVENGHTPAEGLWEVYLVGPEVSDDPAQWRTQLNLPLVV